MSPTKTCDYCKKEGEAFTFMSGETICPRCLSTLNMGTTRNYRQEVYRLRMRVKELEQNHAPDEVYAVLMRRWGNIEGHAYIAGIAPSLGSAIKYGEVACEDRGGKYQFQIIRCPMEGEPEVVHDTCGDQVEHYQELLDRSKELDRLRIIEDAYLAAVAFIDSHVSDPDQTDEMVEKYMLYLTARIKVEEIPEKEQLLEALRKRAKKNIR